MTIDSSQRVGIGTSSPDHKLHLEESDTTSVFLKTENTAGALLVGNNSSGNSFVSSQTSGKDLLFETANSEKMRIDSSGRVGIGKTPSDEKLEVSGALSIEGALLDHKTNATTLHYFSNSGYLRSYGASAGTGQLVFETGGGGGSTTTERMRIDSSGNVGIGTSSETYGADRLNIKGSHKGISTSPGGNLAIFTSDSVAADKGGSIVLGGTYSGTTTYQFAGIAGLKDNSTSGQAGGYLAFYTTNVSNATPERLRITSDGNVGISSTDAQKNLSIGNSQADGIQFNYDTTNAYRNQILNYWNSSIDSRMDFNIARTANATPETIMSVGYNSNVGIGTSSPSAKLEVKGSGDGDLFIGRHSSTGAKLIYGYQSASDGFLELRTAGDVTVSKLSGYIGTPSYFKSNVGIGTTSPSTPLEIASSDNTLLYLNSSTATVYLRLDDANSTNGNFIGATTNDMHFWTNNTERMRIDSSGNVGIGTSSITNSRVQIKGAGNATNTYVDGLKVTSNNETVYTQYNWNGINNNTALSFATGGTERMLIASDGGIFAYNLLASTSVSNPQIRLNISTKELYYQSSSLRYKEEVENLDSQIDKLMNLRTVKFKVKGTNEDATGLIAEEVAEVIPELTFKNEVEGFDEPQIDGVSYGDLPTYLLKAIQEQQEMINELKSEIQTLKSQINS